MPGKADSGTMALPEAYPRFQTTNDMTFTMSGTSQSAAVVSEVVALMLQAQPSLTPTQAKCKLMSSARPAVDASNRLTYTVFQQAAEWLVGADSVGAVACGAVGDSATCAQTGSPPSGATAIDRTERERQSVIGAG